MDKYYLNDEGLFIPSYYETKNGDKFLTAYKYYPINYINLDINILPVSIFEIYFENVKKYCLVKYYSQLNYIIQTYNYDDKLLIEDEYLDGKYNKYEYLLS